MSSIAEEILMHYGMPRRSGRYPWGSGEDPYQHGSRDFIGRIEELKKTGWTETPENIKSAFGMTTTQYRTEKSLANHERRRLNVAKAKSLSEDGLGATEIGRQMGVSESTVRSWLNEESAARMNKAKVTADFLREQVNSKGMIDVTVGVEKELGVSKERLKEALHILEEEGYPTYKGGIPQVTNPGKQINQTVLCVPGTQHKEIYEYDRVKTITEYTSHDDGQTFDRFVYPKSMDSSRLMVRYADDIGPDGARGIEKDGIIELRRGVEDLSLGDAHYAQVRILVDDNKYLKGMAVYSDNMPDGVDVVFNTNKTSDVPKMEVLKGIKSDPDNPFGSLIKPNGQSYYIDKDGNKQLSLINKRADEGDWTEWKDALPSQFLGKQSLHMINKQLGLARADKIAEYDDILSLNNPTIKKHFLEKFADECDSAAVHLQAAALPGQKYHVIIPVNSLKDNEVYAPQYESGTKLALIRYPHGGTFEIPILTVNNKHVAAKNLIGEQSIDAIGINKKNADRLSGADFDGDTVMCIPTHDRFGKVKITSTRELDGLKDFDPKTKYGADNTVVDDNGVVHYYRNGNEYRLMKNPTTGKDSTQMEMGKISNLITDMTLGGANADELAAAVRHSMVVIDAAKHHLDYKQSELDNNISALKKEYQRSINEDGTEKVGGASTILSRSKGEYSVTKRQGSPTINIKGDKNYDPTKPEGALLYKTSDDAYYPDRKYNKDTHEVTIRTTSGKKITYSMDDKDAVDLYTPVKRVNEETGEVTYTNKTGDIAYKTKERTQKSTRMAETDDAFKLVSDGQHPKELAYAQYANDMKAMANQARVELKSTGRIAYSANAKKTYAEEVQSLNDKLDNALLNAPRERAAQRKANYDLSVKKLADPDMSKSEIKKAGQQALTAARQDVGSVRRRDRNIEITDREWEAIQAGAISENKLTQILNNTDTDKLRERAMPRNSSGLSEAKINRIKALSESNYSLNEIAKTLGISASTVSNYLKGAK